jgi:hypothetical protein
MEHLVDFEEEG